MVRVTINYQGDKHCELTHGPSGAKITTDAPKDNQGKGEAFSPTDLVGGALGSCILTTMAIVAERSGIEFKEAEITVEKHMQDSPRRIETLAVNIRLPERHTPDERRRLEAIATNCPVHASLHPDIKMPITFMYT